MAIPPIVSSLPIVKAFTGERPQAQPEQAQPKPAAVSADKGDQISISDEALRRISASSAIQSDNDARSAAQSVKSELSSKPDLSLGLDQNRI